MGGDHEEGEFVPKYLVIFDWSVTQSSDEYKLGLIGDEIVYL